MRRFAPLLPVLLAAAPACSGVEADRAHGSRDAVDADADAGDGAAKAGDATGHVSDAGAPDVGDAGVGEPDDLDAFLLDEMERLHLPGLAFAVVIDGATVRAGGLGWADVDLQLPATADTPFLVASVSKTVTAVALLQVYETGAFDLDDDARTTGRLPFDVAHPRAPATPITYRMLLTHTAGLRDSDVVDEVVAPGDPTLSLSDFLRAYLAPGGRYYDADANFTRRPPGTTWEYSDVGASLAGLLVETLGGEPFDAWCRAHVFVPLGMTATAWHLADLDVPAVAVPYAWQGGRHVPYGHYGFPDYPDGLLRTSARDLARFLGMVMRGGEWAGGRVLATSTVAEMLSEQVRDVTDDQGLVWYRERQGGRTLWGHSGRYDGASAEMFFDAETGVGAVVMANGDAEEDDLDRVVDRLLDDGEEGGGR